MSAKPEPPEEGDDFRSACKAWLKDHLPFGLKAFLPWLGREFRAVRKGWVFFVFLAVLISGAAIVVEEKFRVSPLKEQFQASDKKRIETELRLAPFLAAGDRYLAGVPSAERLTMLLNYLTNSAEDLKALRDFQNRKAQLIVTAVGEGAGWTNETAALFSNAIVYIPLFAGATNSGLHLKVLNLGDLPAETIHLNFYCSDELACSAPQWEEVTNFSGSKEKHFRLKADTLHNLEGGFLGVIKFSTPLTSLSSRVSLTIDAKNMPRMFLPLELFFFKSKKDIGPFVSSNRLAWLELSAR